MTYSSLRMGLYDPIKEGLQRLENNKNDGYTTASPSVWIKWTSAFLSGAIGAALFNPVDLVKVRLQSQLPDQPKPYTSLWQAFSSIYQTEGQFRGLYNGVTTTVVRAAFLTCAQLGSYDIIKNNLLVDQCGMPHEAVSTHFSAALMASVVTTTAANPADVVKTRVMNDHGSVKQSSLYYTQLVYRHHGMAGFLKGWTASYLRIGPHTILSFLLIERIRVIMGMATY